MSLSAWFEAELAKLRAHFDHHHAAGTVPTAPVVAPPPGAAPAAAESPAPAAAPATAVAVPAPAAAQGSTYPAIDADGCIKPAAFVGTPLAGYRCMIQDTYDQPGLSDAVKSNLLHNFNQNFGIRMIDNSSDPFALSGVTEGDNYLIPRMQPSNNPPSYGDVLVFPAKNTANGWPGFTLADCAAFVAHCQQTGKWPKIDHTGNGVVAHA